MTKFWVLMVLLMAAGLLIFTGVPAQSAQGKTDMKVKLVWDDNEVIMHLYDTPAAQEMWANLPAELTFEDYAGKEKIAYLPYSPNTKQTPGSAVPKAGEVAIFAPWGNLAIFYKDHKNTPDSSLIPIGQIESGLARLATQKTSFKGKLERF